MTADQKPETDQSSTAETSPTAGQSKSKSRAQNQKDILDRFDAMVGPLPYDVRKAMYFHICAAISEELMDTGCAFMPTLGWLTVNTIPKDNGKLEVRPSFKVSRELKDEIKQQVRDALDRGEHPTGRDGATEDSDDD